MATIRTSPWLGGMSGRLGNVYLADTPHGTQLRALPERRKPRTPGELAQQARLERIATAWRALDGDTMREWSAYAQALTLAQPAGARRPVSGYNAFSALGSTLLRVRNDGPLPARPPSGPFLGDAATIAASGPLPSPERQEGALTFAADQANAPGVLTELLTQPLANAARAIRPKAYVSQGFIAFADGRLEATVAADPGWHACAIRFVREATGQETALVPCGVVRAGP